MELFQYYLVDFPELPQLVENLFPLVKEDRDELVRQVFDHFLNVNGLDPTVPFRLNAALLRLSLYGASPPGGVPSSLVLLAQNVFSHIYDRLVWHGFHRMVEAQGDFYFVLDHIRDNGHQVVLRNISPSTHSTLPRHDPALHP